ncbi:MAG: nuclease [Terriglobales bacterium]
MNYCKRCVALLLIALLVPVSVWGWGFEGHIWVNQVAASKVPREMPAFFRKEKKLISYLGYEPDRWRDSREVSLRNAQAPDHYIDFELITDIAELPRERYDFYRLLYEKRAAALATPAGKAAGEASAKSDDLLPEGVGLQPYITMEVYERLRAAFREYRALKLENKPAREVEKKAVFYAGWLGHYVADGSQPMHTSIHHHGWVGENPNQYTTDGKIHAQFESVYVAAKLKAGDFQDLVQAPVRLADPFADYVKYLRESNGQIEEFYKLEKTGAFAGPGTPAGHEYTRRCLARGSQMLLNLWYTAWLQSADPAPPRAPFDRDSGPPPKYPMAPPPTSPRK